VTTTSAEPIDQQPDWQTIEREVLCPLCEYNLRGLSAPRCPECGYQFVWSELLAADRQPHPYLFEHHRHHNIWSFWKTAVGGIHPSRFWKTLTPVQPSHPGRLLAYWVMAAMIGVVGFMSLVLQESIDQTFSTRSRGYWVQTIFRQGDWRVEYRRHDLLIELAGIRFHYEIHPFAAVAAEAILLWPWGTILALMIFRISMRQAKVRPVHVLRCALYSADVVIWAGLSCALIMVAYGSMSAAGRTEPFQPELFFFIVLAVTGGVFIRRLVVSYQTYLRFDRPLLTIACTQLIVGLAWLWALLTWSNHY
jgi:hypothetical protein